MDNCWKRKSWLRIDVAQGCHVPYWYGLAYLDYVSDHAICYPIPLNWLVRWGRKIYDKVCFPNISSGEYARGWQDGMRAVRERAYRDGYAQGLEDGRNKKEDFTSLH